MKKIRLILLICGAALAAGCAGDSMNTNTSSNVRTPVKTPFSTPQTTPVATTTNSGMKSANTQANREMAKKSSSPLPTSTPAPSTAEKKDEGLFSFPPPRVTSVAEVKTDPLRSGAETTLAQVSEKLAAGLEKAGYKRGRYKYFWNDKEEFAIVTAMERVAPDGANLPEADRWVEDDHLPKARSFGEYIHYLIYGKKAFYRVFAFVVTARRDASDFGDGTPPDFEMAKNWKSKGKSKLGGTGEPTSVENVVFNEKYNCFALVYLFVNHTSLDRTKSVDALNDDEKWLQEELVKDADSHLEKTNIRFGG
jgi:hypothetical protein